MYRDDYFRDWQGTYPFEIDSIAANAPQEFGVYQVLYPFAGTLVPAYIGIATGDTIRGRLTKHKTGAGNWALARLTDPSSYVFVFYICDVASAREIESHVVTMKKPPFNVRPEYRDFIPSIAVH